MEYGGGNMELQKWIELSNEEELLAVPVSK